MDASKFSTVKTLQLAVLMICDDVTQGNERNVAFCSRADSTKVRERRRATVVPYTYREQESNFSSDRSLAPPVMADATSVDIEGVRVLTGEGRHERYRGICHPIVAAVCWPSAVVVDPVFRTVNPLQQPPSATHCFLIEIMVSGHPMTSKVSGVPSPRSATGPNCSGLGRKRVSHQAGKESTKGATAFLCCDLSGQ